MDQQLTSADGTLIAFETHGPTDGPTIIEVHGATAFRAIQNAAPGLADAIGYRAVSFDRRGRGGSGDAPEYAVEREIEDLAALVAEAPDGAWLIGESSGAVLALEAARSGIPLRGVVLYEPPFVVNDGRPPVPADYTERLDDHLAAGRRLEAFKQFSLEGVGMPAEMVEGIEHGPYWPLVGPVAHTLAYDARVMADTMRGSADPLKKYADVGVPALVLVGSETFPFMHTAAEAIAAVLRDAEIVRLSGADHQLQPSIVADAVRAFIQRTRA